MSIFTVVDIFCGAGGFSVGFRQEGFKIVAGIDNWKPAIDTFNYNFGLDCKPYNMLDLERSAQRIEELPDTDVIIGSPPCVSFSTSNKSGKGDKSLGLKLTKMFLRVVAVKKHKPNSILKAWFMENVANSKIHLPQIYTFESLGLKSWASNNGLDPESIAVNLEDNRSIINAADYGAPQSRIRVFTGEIIRSNKHLIPKPTHKSSNQSGALPNHITLGFIRKNLPAPNSSKSDEIISDPLYPHIKIKKSDLTDQFYDTGLYACDWKGSKFLKTNHPYMGFMYFPEREDRPSRTVTATKIGNSREAIILRSESKRVGDGEYRTLTIREAATLMGFPITFQFVGSEGCKWKLAGNAVCPSVSRAFANLVRQEYKMDAPQKYKIDFAADFSKVQNLNAFQRKTFNAPPQRKKGARFRRHPIKDGNLTVTLSNYDIEENSKSQSAWKTSIQYGTGAGFPIQKIPDGYFRKLEPIIMSFENGQQFINDINNGFSKTVANAEDLQEMYEKQQNHGRYLNPVDLVEKVRELVDSVNLKEPNYDQQKNMLIMKKNPVPKKQVLALYAINKICSIANGGE